MCTMATVAQKKDLTETYKKWTVSNVYLLNKVQTLPPALNCILSKENALEKPTQNLFNHLTYYLVSIIDPQVHNGLTWPLYDTKAERAYRMEVSNFINNYSSKGLISPVLSSYLVNPGSYKVTVLLFQLSKLAMQEILKAKMNESQKKKYNEMTEIYQQKDTNFIETIDKETLIIQNKSSNYLYKRKIVEHAAEKLRTKITDMENKLSDLKCQDYIKNLVDNYLQNHKIDEELKTEILKIKNLNEHSKYFDYWLQYVDSRIEAMEDTWNVKVNPFLDLTTQVYEQTDSLIKRHTGQMEKSLYTIEYDAQTDKICTDQLEEQVNSQQKFILKNLERDGRLSFPNLLRAYVVSISFILNNNVVGEEIFQFNEYFDASRRNYKEVLLALASLTERIKKAESKLEIPSTSYDLTAPRDNLQIPVMPDLSDLKMNRGFNITAESYTPFNINKNQFKLLRKTNEQFNKPIHRNLAPIYQAPKDDFLKSLISCRVSAYDINGTHYNDKTAVSSHKGNETIAECTGFTKEQITRLLSTRKSSSSKKFRNKQERPILKKKGALFDESILSNDSNGMYRSYSSPNLFENKERRPINKIQGRKLSIMKEDSRSQFEMTGITSLDFDIDNTPQGIAESSRKEENASTPVIMITNTAEERINNILSNMGNNISPIIEVSPILSGKDNMSPLLEAPKSETLKVETPQSNSQLIKKTSSLEKIINRFKRVRASVLPEREDIRTIVEEKNILTNRLLLPDLLSPSCSNKPSVNINYDQIDIDKPVRRPRESLGTVLGVDETFLDQFDLID
ncbi:uncharacterized protein LOC121737575 [Aricia agestis]|uniref:uncharacterized protein LOC121737575 n=1 Tax=Aricia agestis TaxID=91739 RepID=UPI001C207A1A|nr:uncharacterized protein LOC121737575 [Aricia agestis]